MKILLESLVAEQLDISLKLKTNPELYERLELVFERIKRIKLQKSPNKSKKSFAIRKGKMTFSKTKKRLKFLSIAQKLQRRLAAKASAKKRSGKKLKPIKAILK